MRRSRSERESIVDGLFCLSLLYLCSPTDPVGDRLKVMKLLFLATHDMFRGLWKGMNFSFYRYSYGPFTPQVYETWEDLSLTGLISVAPEPWGQISLTSDGQNMARTFVDEVLSTPANIDFGRVLRSIADSYATDTTKDLLNKVYARQVRPVGWQEDVTVGAVPEGVYLTRVVEEFEARQVFQVDDVWLTRYDLMRKQQVAAALDIPFFEKAEVVREIHEALEAERRGEGVSYTLDQLKHKYGLE